MKKMLFVVLGSVLLLSANAAPNRKVLNAFNASFKKAENVKWEEFPDHYTVYFSWSGIRTTLHYDTEGNVIGSTRYYKPDQLPLHLFNKLKKEYPERELFGVTEVSVGDDVNYYVKMLDSKHWFTILLDAAGNSRVYEKYKKG